MLLPRARSIAASSVARATPSEIAAKPSPNMRVGRDAVERTFLAQRREIVAQRGEFFRDEQILDRIGIGAGAAQPDHVPDVVHGGARRRKHDGADFRRAVRLHPPRAVGFEDLDMGAEPVRLARAAGEIPARGDRDSRRGRPAPSLAIAPQARMSLGLSKISCATSRIEIGRRHGADRALAEAPGRGGIGLGDFLQHLHENHRRRFGAADVFAAAASDKARFRSGRKPPAG